MTREEATGKLVGLCDKGTAMIPLGYVDNFVSKLIDQHETEITTSFQLRAMATERVFKLLTEARAKDKEIKELKQHIKEQDRRLQGASKWGIEMLGKLIAWIVGGGDIFKEDIKKAEYESFKTQQEEQYLKSAKAEQEYQKKMIQDVLVRAYNWRELTIIIHDFMYSKWPLISKEIPKNRSFGNKYIKRKHR